MRRSTVRRIVSVLFGLIVVLSLQASPKDIGTAVEIVARTESGKRVMLTTVAESDRIVRIGPADESVSIDDPIIDIEGLDALSNLEELEIVLLPQLTEYDFLSRSPGLNALTVSYGVLPGLGFIKLLPSLEMLRIEMCRGPSGGPVVEGRRIPLESVRRIERLILIDCGFEGLPELIDAPDTLVYLDLSWNGFSVGSSDARVLRGYRDIDTVVLAGIEVENRLLEEYPNLLVPHRRNVRE